VGAADYGHGVPDPRGESRFLVLAFADELVADPSLLEVYGRLFSGRDAATLLVYAPDSTPAEAERALRPLVVRAGLEGEEGADILACAVPGGEETERALARQAACLYSQRLPAPAFASLPRVGKENVQLLRRMAEERWANGRASPPPGPARSRPAKAALRVGWLRDHWPQIGGAELSADARAAAAPAGVEIVPCPPGAVDPRCDVYVVNQSNQYTLADAAAFNDRPVFKVVPDWWEGGDPALRRWLLRHAALVFFASPLHRDLFRWPVAAPTMLCPAPLDLAPFRAAAARAGARRGAVWVGQMTSPWKGYEEAVAWARRRRRRLDFYGRGPYAPSPGPYVRVFDEVPYAQLPALLARYRTLVFLPRRPQPFPRILVEAWAAGCELVTSGANGASWWIENAPAELDRGAERFWSAVLDSVGAAVPAAA
jgi:glycosyltransferase involved in cell wall biosynthesis